ncbi:2,5-diketo-D-gluconate reductase B [Bosea sp. BK604]|nr:2,5-diketo-D-gluconate reductase B [Bosea sp. BK604]
MPAVTGSGPVAAMIHTEINGVSLPVLGFGTYHLTGPEGVKAIRHALDLGYRYLDTATRYGNEEEVGQAIAESGIDRDRIFLATKLRYVDLDPATIEDRVKESLARLRVDHVDLLMPHWPSPTIPVAPIMEAFARVRDKGYATHIGVSNFPTDLMREAIKAFDGPIFSNQVEYHPFIAQSAVLDQLRSHGILLTAAVPLARGAIDDEPVIREIAESYGKTTAQITLRWLIQQPGVTAIPKSGQPERIRQNLEIFDFALSEDEMARIGALQRNLRLVDVSWAPVWDAPG